MWWGERGWGGQADLPSIAQELADATYIYVAYIHAPLAPLVAMKPSVSWKPVYSGLKKSAIR